MECYAGIDWASKMHALCVVDEEGARVLEDFFAHTEVGIGKLIATMQELAVSRVTIERPDGLLVDRLVEAGFAVSPVRSDTLKAMGPRYAVAGAKSDAFDAFCLAELARTDSHRYPTLQPDSDETKALRALTRAREELIRNRIQLANQLRAQLDGFWPGAAKIFANLESKIALAFLQRYPSPEDARGLDEKSLEAFLKASVYRNHRPPSELLERLHSAPSGSAGRAETEARRIAVLGLVAALEPIVNQISELDTRIAKATRAHPAGKIFLPLFKDPGSVLTAARLIAEIGDDRARYPTPEALAAKAGMVPVARESGKRKAVVFRRACDKRLRSTVARLAESTRQHHPWAKDVYVRARERGAKHPHALRILGRAWLRVLWRCWQDDVAYDPAKHGNLQRMQLSED